jgi:hypothetical protein
MAASQNPMTLDFHFQNINIQAIYRSLFLISPGDLNKSEIGDLVRDTQNLHYRVNFNGGRLGNPGLEVYIEHVPSRRSAKVIFEPGVSHGPNFHLHSFSTEWLGRPGGGGHMYNKDPVSVRNLPLDVKKRTLKVRIQTFGHVSPDPSAIGALLNVLPANSLARQLLARSTAWVNTSFEAWIYCVVPEDSVTAFEARSLAPLRLAVANRLPPYHQLSHPQNVLNLSMPRLPGFRNGIYFSATSTAPAIQYGGPILPLADTRGRRAPLPVAQVHANGVIREEQCYETFCNGIAATPQFMKLIRASSPVLGSPTAAYGSTTPNPAVVLPNDQAPFFGCVDRLNFAGQYSILLPRAGEIFALSWWRQQADGTWAPTGENACGIVLRLSDADHTTAGTCLVLGLSMLSEPLKQRASRHIVDAVADVVRFGWVPNAKVAHIELDALRQFSTQAVVPMVASLQANVLFQPLGARNVPQTRRDLRNGPSPPYNNTAELTHRVARYNSGVQDLCSLPQMANMTQNETKLLNRVPGRIDGFFQMLHTSPVHVQFRALGGLALALTNAGNPNGAARKGTHQILVVVEDQSDCSRICYALNDLVQAAKTHGRNDGELWKRKKIVSYSTVELNHQFAPPRDTNAIQNTNLSHPLHPLREQMELAFEQTFSDLPEHSAILDQQGAYLNAHFANPPAGRTPYGMSMGDATMVYHFNNPVNRNQYYTDRAAVIDNQPLSFDEIHDVRGRRHGAVRNALKDVDILVTNAATATSSDVKASFATPIIMLINAHHTTFAQANSVFMAYPKLEAAFVVGADGHTLLPGTFASLGNNEASESYFRSFWTMLRNNRANCFTL